MAEKPEEPKKYPIEVSEAKDIAEFYNIPQSLVNMFFMSFNNVLYPKEPFLLFQGHKKGIQRIEVKEPVKDVDGEWRTEAKIYPKVDAKILEQLSKFDREERKAIWEHLSEPTVEWGHASSKNVHMSTMQQWLPEIAIKRAVCRALRKFAGVGQTSFEEMPQVEIPEDAIKNARNITKKPKHEEPGQVKLPA